MLTPLPVVLQTDPVLFPITTPRGAFGASPAMLRNTDDLGVLIDKILVVGIPVDGSLLSPVTHVQGVSIRLRWRNEPLTNGFQPIAAIAYPRNSYFEEAIFGGVAAGDNGAMVIHLARPFYLPSNDFVSVEFQWELTSPDVNGFNSPLALQAYAIGKQAPKPTQRWMPYMTAMIPPFVSGEVAATYEALSSTLDLGNPFDVPLQVERLIGRVIASGNTGYDTVFDNGPNPVWALFKVKIADDRDNIWVPTPTPVPSVFDVIDRSWLVGVTMPPKSYLNVSIEKDVTLWNVANYARFQRPVIGMVGYRQIVSEE